MQVIKETPEFVLIWDATPVGWADHIVITSKGKIKRNIPDGSWIGINKRGIAKAKSSVVII
jgi:hypothetical protein